MKINCPRFICSSYTFRTPNLNRVVRTGSFFRKSDSRKISKYFCNSCRTHFSSATLRADRYQKKRRINFKINQLACSGISQRRLAVILRVNRKTIVRKFRFLAEQERSRHREFLDNHFKSNPLTCIQFDDLETAEHTKCKPLSVTLAVEPKTRKILMFKVSSMPAKGLLAKVSYQKYGPRLDQRPERWDQFMRELTPYVSKNSIWSSDENPF